MPLAVLALIYFICPIRSEMLYLDFCFRNLIVNVMKFIHSVWLEGLAWSYRTSVTIPGRFGWMTWILVVSDVFEVHSRSGFPLGLLITYT